MSILQQRGTTLVELIITIVVLSVALVGILLVMNRTTSSSADPMILHQSVAIAEAYLEEITTRDFNDPDGTNVGETRSSFDDISDYNGLVDTGARNQLGGSIAGLESYTVSVSVTGSALTGSGQTVSATDSRLITVSVSHPAQSGISLSVYKMNPN